MHSSKIRLLQNSIADCRTVVTMLYKFIDLSVYFVEYIERNIKTYTCDYYKNTSALFSIHISHHCEGVRWSAG